MSEQDAPVAPEAADPTPDTAAEVAPAEPGEDFDAARALEKIRKANAEAKQLRERAKTAEDRATNLETQAARATELEAQLVRERVARRIGLPDALVDRLRGTTEDEVMADAESLVALVAPKVTAKQAKPVESLQPGSGTPQQSGPVQLFSTSGMSPAEVEAARAAGQFRDLMAGKSA